MESWPEMGSATAHPTNQIKSNQNQIKNIYFHYLQWLFTNSQFKNNARYNDIRYQKYLVGVRVKSIM